MIKNISEINKNDAINAGAKGANLGELKNNKFNVPNGFVVTTNAYFDFLKHNTLKEILQKKHASIFNNNLENIDKITQEVQLMFNNANFSNEFVHQINRVLKDFSTNLFAVRSSAVCEDSQYASFAGQFDTFLNVNKEKIISKIKKCFASLYSPRVISYSKHNKVSNNEGIAVVVQEMVLAKFAGVIFTVDPLKKENMFIEVAPGLGENVVSGHVHPNSYAINRESLAIEIVYEKTSFAQNLILKIAQIALKIEQLYQYPQDIEFAIYNNEIYLLQTRPITTLSTKIISS